MDDPVQQLIRRLGSRDEAARKAAEEELLAMGPRAADTIVEMLRRAARRRWRLRWMVYGIGLGAQLLSFVLMASRWEAYRAWSSTSVWHRVLAGIWQTCGMMPTFVVAMFAGATSRENNGARLLARMDDPRLAGPLAEMLDEHSEVRTALPRLLLRLTPEDARRLDERQRAMLRKHLGWFARRGELDQAEVDMAEAILRALTAAGDTEALPTMRRLAEDRYRDHGERARKAARECLPVLERMQAVQQESRTLLRASVGGEATELLRPASGSAAEGDGDTLLRPLEQRAAAGDEGEG